MLAIRVMNYPPLPSEKPSTNRPEYSNELEPVLDETEGHFLIGDKTKATNIYCLSVTIAAAKNLAKVYQFLHC